MSGFNIKKLNLGFHIFFSGIWTGSLLILLILNLSKYDHPEWIYSYDQIILMIHDHVITNCAWLLLLTGLYFAAFTPWGFFKQYWLILKWISILLLFLFIMFVMTPSINTMVALSDLYHADSLENQIYLDTVFKNTIFIIIELLLLFGIIQLSTAKPWGTVKIQFNFRYQNKLKLAAVCLIFFGILSQILMNYFYLEKLRSMELGIIELKNFPAGEYTGISTYGSQFIVKTTIENGKITDFEVIKHHNNFYSNLAKKVRYKVLKKQNFDVEGLSGATTTSRIYLKTALSAFQKSR